MPVTISDFTFPTMESPAEVTQLKALAEAYTDKTDRQIAGLLLKRELLDFEVGDDVPQIPDPAKFEVENLLSLLGASVAAIPEDSLYRVGEEIEQGDVKAVLRAASVWKGKQYIDDAQFTALVTEASATVNDPTAKKVGTSPFEDAFGRQPGSLKTLEITKAKELG